VREKFGLIVMMMEFDSIIRSAPRLFYTIWKWVDKMEVNPGKE
jgi:hypothetical protein